MSTAPAPPAPNPATPGTRDRGPAGRTATGPARVTIDQLTRVYGAGPPALDRIDVTIEPGTTLCVLGPSGCGKSTLLRLVAGLEAPDRGTVTVGDRVLSRPGSTVVPERRNVNMVFQDYALWPHLRVRDIIGYGLKVGVNRTSAHHRAARVDELVRLLRLEGLEGRRPAEISGGQQQRVAIARALATSPDLLLFDEPLSNLDTQLREAMREELSVLLGSLGTTALYVTHDVAEALALADRILVLHDGREVQLDTPRSVFAQPRSGWVAGLAGFSSVLHVDRATAMGADTPDAAVAGRARATIGVGNDRREIVGRDCGRDHHGSTPTAKAYVHPDAVRLGGVDASLQGVVLASVFEGRAHRTSVDLVGAGTVVVRTPERCTPGERVGIEIDPDGVLVFGATP